MLMLEEIAYAPLISGIWNIEIFFLCFLQPATELVKEIATLELEVLRLERYLLSLYRETFDRYQATSLIKDQVRKLPSKCRTGSSISQGEDESKLMSLHLESSLPNSSKSKWNESQSIEDIHRKRGIKFQDVCCKSNHNLADSKDISVPATGNISTVCRYILKSCFQLTQYSFNGSDRGVSETIGPVTWFFIPWNKVFLFQLYMRKWTINMLELIQTWEPVF